MSEAQRYILTVQKIPREARDEFRRLESPETYFEIRPGEVGQRVAYAVEMTEQEVDRARRVEADPSSNLIALEPERRMQPHSVPGVATVNFLAMQGAVGDSQLNGSGVDVGVIDDGLSPSIASQFTIKASKGYPSGGGLDDGINVESGHGSKMASLAIPPSSRLVFGGSGGYLDAELIALMYWMVDEVGIDIMSLSWGNSGSSTALDDATSHAASLNVIIFGSRGNNNNSNAEYPALSPGVRAISAYDTSTGAKASYSSFGDVFAASVGDSINWLTSSGSEQESRGAGGGGTSAATALASHVAARLMSGGRSPGNVVGYLETHARRTGASPLYEGHGVLQLDSAANQMLRDQPGKTNLDGTPAAGQDGCLAA